MELKERKLSHIGSEHGFHAEYDRRGKPNDLPHCPHEFMLEAILATHLNFMPLKHRSEFFRAVQSKALVGKSMSRQNKPSRESGRFFHR
jgi:hypothetical protein